MQNKWASKHKPWGAKLPAIVFFVEAKWRSASFLIIIVTYKSMHICMCKYILLSPFSVFSVASIPMCLGMKASGCIAHLEAHPCKILILSLSAALNCLDLFIYGGLVRFPASMLGCQQVLLLCRSCLTDQVVAISWVQLLCCVQKILSHTTNFLVLCLFLSLCSLFMNILLGTMC